MVLEESTVGAHPRQQPPGSNSRARTARLTLRDCARFMLAKGKLSVSIGGKVFLKNALTRRRGHSPIGIEPVERCQAGASRAFVRARRSPCIRNRLKDGRGDASWAG
jgi:hypothetical protein